jgi:hypothetical protein
MSLDEILIITPHFVSCHLIPSFSSSALLCSVLLLCPAFLLLCCSVLCRLSTVLARLGREVEAEPLMRKSLEIREKHMGASHPLVGITLGFLAGILEGQEKYGDETEVLLLLVVYQYSMYTVRASLFPQIISTNQDSACLRLPSSLSLSLLSST